MELVSSGLYDTQNDFAVVIQPALQLPPKTKVREAALLLFNYFSVISVFIDNVSLSENNLFHFPRCRSRSLLIFLVVSGTF